MNRRLFFGLFLSVVLVLLAILPANSQSLPTDQDADGIVPGLSGLGFEAWVYNYGSIWALISWSGEYHDLQVEVRFAEGGVNLVSVDLSNREYYLSTSPNHVSQIVVRRRNGGVLFEFKNDNAVCLPGPVYSIHLGGLELLNHLDQALEVQMSSHSYVLLPASEGSSLMLPARKNGWAEIFRDGAFCSSLRWKLPNPDGGSPID